MAMDVDEDEDATQRPKEVQDFGIEIDFETLDEDDREVRSTASRGLSESLMQLAWAERNA